MTEPAAAPELISDDEGMGRFLTSRSHWRPSDLSVRHQALLPFWNEALRVWETSVFRIDRLTSSEVRDLGLARVRSPDRRIYGHAWLTGRQVRASGLDATPAEPPPRHAVVVGWPDEKSARMSRAQALAKDLTATLYAAE